MNNINNTLVVSLFEEKVQFIRVKFNSDDSSSWTYKTLRPDIRIGDLVIVPAKNNISGESSNPEEYKLVTVTEINVDIDIYSSVQYKWIVSTVDLAEYRSILARELQLITEINQLKRRKQKSELLNQIREEYGVALDTLKISLKEFL